MDLLVEELDRKRYFKHSKYIIWLDNLFISIKLLTQLCKEGIGAVKTV